MTILLDTHTFLWFANDDPDLSTEARRRIEEPGADVVLSIASVWELSIRAALKKIDLPAAVDVFVPQQLLLNSIRLLPVNVSHALRVASLPHHHGDPSDRMLVAQSLVENVPIVSRDKILSRYGVACLW